MAYNQVLYDRRSQGEAVCRLALTLAEAFSGDEEDLSAEAAFEQSICL